MYKTIEAIYDEGVIHPLKNEELKVKKAKVLLTILEVYDENKPTFSTSELSKLADSITLREDPLEYQKRIRDEW